MPLSKRKAQQASLILGFSFLGTMAIRFGGNLVLTRLLFPEAFGLMFIINTIMIGLGMFSDIGVRGRLITSNSAKSKAFVDTAWTISVLRGFAVSSIALLLAFPLASFYGSVEYLNLFLIASLAPAISGFASVTPILYEKELKLWATSAIELTSALLAMITMIALAFCYKDVWVLVAGNLIGAACKVGLSYALTDRKVYRFRLEKNAYLSILSYGKWVLMATALTFFALNFEKLALGKALSLAALGVFSIAAAITRIVDRLASMAADRLIFPMLRQSIENKDVVLRHFQIARRWIMVLVSFPCLIVAIYGNKIVDLLYDSRYQSAGTLIQILVMGALFNVLYVVSYAAIRAHARPKYNTLVQLYSLLLKVVLLSSGYLLYGTLGLLLALPVSMFFVAITTEYVLLKMLHFKTMSGVPLTIIPLALIVAGWAMYTPPEWRALLELSH